MNKRKPILRIAKVADKVFVTGNRGEWDVRMWVQLAGDSGATPCAVRVNQWDTGFLAPEIFNPFLYRDTARQVRDSVLHVLASQPDRPVWVQVIAGDKTGGQRPFINKDYAIVSFCAKDFSHFWRTPRNTVRMIDRRQSA